MRVADIQYNKTDGTLEIQIKVLPWVMTLTKIKPIKEEACNQNLKV